MADDEYDAGPPPPPADGSPPPEAESGRGAWRLTFAYDDAGVRLVAQQRVAMMAPPDDSDLTLSARAGYWVEVRDGDGHGLYRQVLHDPIQTDYEVHTPQAGVSPTRIAAPNPAGVFQAVVPDLPGALDVVLHGQPARADLARDSAVPLVTETLRETPPPGAR